ncbi:polysaccharide lyase family 1 protein [Sphaerosporella brunnea]|uniref:pectin lyase n=1 Tax=Sphaerosporella brunnea TaxID=1250544 RepID=A0A5J5EJ77_9PEZI|nr:polysaccharide lyase family 1 protein [Sphaerosporella brunnea]KAA8895742.1 polysaccharide lyase family 1 protein [Sphaerosporella brunnea]
MLFYVLFTAILAPSAVLGVGVTGTAPGFATGTTGGGSATPAYPSDIAQLKSWLADSTPRVIMLNKEYNFIGSSGTVAATGCRPSSNTCPSNGGQDAINGANWCTNSNYPSVSVTYDAAALTPLAVGSNKSIVGVGSKGVIRGVGLKLSGGVSNVIIQNVHITELNPQYIWGGDAITLAGCNKVWIDHCKISLIGRQMLVTGYDAAGLVAVTNTEFDGSTSWSATCNGDHYWTMLFYGSADHVTLAGNYIHDVSGRAPKVGGSGSTTLHAANNYFQDVGGHAFEVGTGAKVLIEGNVFDAVTTPITAASASAGGLIYNAGGSACSPYIGRGCQANSVSNSGAFDGYGTVGAMAGFAGYAVYPAVAASKVASSVVANAGVGKL